MTRRKRKKTWIKWLIGIILVVAAALVVYFVWNEYFREKPAPNDKSSSHEESSKKEEKSKEEESKNNEEGSSGVEPEKEKVPQYDGEDPNNSTELTGVLTHAEVSNGSLVIRVNIDQYLERGSCILALRRGGANIYSDNANIISAASTSTCEGFNIPVSSLGEGKTNIIIYISSGEKHGEITGEVEL